MSTAPEGKFMHELHHPDSSQDLKLYDNPRDTKTSSQRVVNALGFHSSAVFVPGCVLSV